MLSSTVHAANSFLGLCHEKAGTRPVWKKAFGGGTTSWADNPPLGQGHTLGGGCRSFLSSCSPSFFGHLLCVSRSRCPWSRPQKVQHSWILLRGRGLCLLLLLLHRHAELSADETQRRYASSLPGLRGYQTCCQSNLNCRNMEGLKHLQLTDVKLHRRRMANFKRVPKAM